MKNTVRKIAALVVCAALVIASFAGCAGGGDKNGRISIVATVFPEYDWVRQIIGDDAENIELDMLLDNGVDLHSYQPTVDDIVKITSCDMFIYVGGESDKWVQDALAHSSNKDMIVINLLDMLDGRLMEEELVEGMEPEEEEEEEDGQEEEGPEYDEHVWLSLRNASVLCGYIAEKLCSLDRDNAEKYRANADAYITELAGLDARYEEVVENAPVKTLLFGDRFPFRYMTEDYGLEYYAAFLGCSAESEASFGTVAALAGKVDELGLSSIMTIEGSDGSLARTIRDNTATKDQEIRTLDSMQSVTSDDVKNGATYLSVMENNLAVLEQALK